MDTENLDVFTKWFRNGNEGGAFILSSYKSGAADKTRAINFFNSKEKGCWVYVVLEKDQNPFYFVSNGFLKTSYRDLVSITFLAFTNVYEAILGKADAVSLGQYEKEKNSSEV